MRKIKLEALGRMSVEEFRAAEKFPIVLVLDNIRSFHNTGSVFRSADAFRVAEIVLCGYTPTPPHREIRKTAIGAEEAVDWRYEKEITDALKQLKADGWKIVALEHTDRSIPLGDFTWNGNEKLAVVLGNEVDGVQESALEICDAAVEIPQFGTKHSLNVSVAAGVLLYGLMTNINLES